MESPQMTTQWSTRLSDIHRELAEDMRVQYTARQAWLGLLLTSLNALAVLIYRFMEAELELAILLLWALFYASWLILKMSVSTKRSLNSHAFHRKLMEGIELEDTVGKIHVVREFSRVFRTYIKVLTLLTFTVFAIALTKSFSWFKFEGVFGIHAILFVIPITALLLIYMNQHVIKSIEEKCEKQKEDVKKSCLEQLGEFSNGRGGSS